MILKIITRKGNILQPFIDHLDFYLILINSDAPDPRATAGHVITAAVTPIDKTVN